MNAAPSLTSAPPLKPRTAERGGVVAAGVRPAADPGLLEWYCVHTRPQKEGQTAARLRDTLGLETYYPRLRRQRTIRRMKRVVLSPLFPRYLFCRFDFPAGYRAVRYARDVVDVVSFGRAPAVVARDLIANLKTWAGDSVDIITLEPGLRRGDHVKITDGPLRGLEAVVENEMNGRERVAVVLSILERTVQTLIHREHITRVG